MISENSCHFLLLPYSTFMNQKIYQNIAWMLDSSAFFTSHEKRTMMLGAQKLSDTELFQLYDEVDRFLRESKDPHSPLIRKITEYLDKNAIEAEKQKQTTFRLWLQEREGSDRSKERLESILSNIV